MYLTGYERRGLKIMINVDIDQSHLEEIIREELKAKIEEIEKNIFFMDSKQLQEVVNMSWNSIVTHFMSDPEFPKIRLGNKWLFNRKEVFAYLDKFYEAVRDSGGDIQKYVRK